MALDNILYFMEYKYIPEICKKIGPDFIGSVVHDVRVLNKVLTDICAEEGLENPFTDDSWDRDYVRMSQNIFILKIKFPAPFVSPLAYSGYLVYDRDFKKVKYYTLEKSDSRFGSSVIVGSMESGNHYNYGELDELGFCLDDEGLFDYFYQMYGPEEEKYVGENSRNRDTEKYIKWFEHHVNEYVEHGIAANDDWGENYFLDRYMPDEYSFNAPIIIAMAWSSVNSSRLYNRNIIENDGDEYSKKAVELHKEAFIKKDMDIYWKWFVEEYLMAGIGLNELQCNRFKIALNDLANSMCKRKYGQFGCNVFDK